MYTVDLINILLPRKNEGIGECQCHHIYFLFVKSLLTVVVSCSFFSDLIIDLKLHEGCLQHVFDRRNTMQQNEFTIVDIGSIL